MLSINRNLIILFLISFASFSSFLSCKADEKIENDAKKYANKLINSLIEDLFNEKISNKKKDKISHIIANNFDLKWNSNVVLGRNKKTFNDNQLNDYYKLYEEFFINSSVLVLIETTKEQNGQVPKIDIYRVGIINDQELTVEIKLSTKIKEIELSARIIASNNKDISEFKIRNLVIEGIDSVISRRKEFDQQINNYGVEKFLENLRSKVFEINNKLSEV
jgi:ABC-type transporter MlaC component